MLTIRCISDKSSFDGLQSVWNPLLEKSQSTCFFLTWEWVSTWLEVYGFRYALSILVAENENKQVLGIAPLMVGKGSGKLGQFQRCLMFISQGTDVTPEYLDFIIMPNNEPEIVALFAHSIAHDLRNCWDILYFQRVLNTSVNIHLFTSLLGSHGIKINSNNEDICRFAVLDNSWGENLKNRSQSFRKRWNYNLSRLNRDGNVNCLFVPTDISLGEAFDKLIELNQERWGELGASFRTDAYVHFHRLLCQKIEPLGWLVMVQMTQNGQVAAAKYDYLYAGKLWGNQGGWSMEFQKKNVGEILIGKLFAWGIEKGIKEYDFLGGDAEYKKRWGTDHRLMNDWTAHNTTWRGKMWQLVACGKESLRECLPQQVLEKLKKKQLIQNDEKHSQTFSS